MKKLLLVLFVLLFIACENNVEPKPELISLSKATSNNILDYQFGYVSPSQPCIIFSEKVYFDCYVNGIKLQRINNTTFLLFTIPGEIKYTVKGKEYTIPYNSADFLRN